MNKYLIAAFCFALTSFSFSQNKLDNIEFLVGNWQGVESDAAGDGIGFRSYTYELDENYIMVRNQSTFPKTEKKPKGEVHRDIGIFSYNSNSNEIIYRSFNVEGFTNIFILDSSNSSKDKFVFITREIENNPGNWRARVIIEKLSETEFIESFDIATDGENYSNLLSNHWYKVK
jgi:hypothetical protein